MKDTLPVILLRIAPIIGVSVCCFAQSDTTPPQIVNFSISPTSVDVSNGPVTINVRIAASDNLSGFGSGSTGSGSIDIRHQSGANPIGRGSLPITGGTSLHPVFEFTLTMPQFSQTGVYPINITLIDNVFNTLYVTPDSLRLRGFPSAITVVAGQPSQLSSTITTIPHLATGDGWQTTIRASGACVEGCTLEIVTYDNYGTVIGTTTLPLSATSAKWARSIIVPSAPTLSTGWIEVKATSKSIVGICASALFTHSNSKQEASSSSSCIQASGWESGAFGAMHYFYSHVSGYTSGVALLNKAPVSLSASLEWRDESDVIVASRAITLLPRQQTSFTSSEAIGRYGRFSVVPDPSMTPAQKEQFGKSVYSLGFQFSPFGSFTQLAPIN